MPQHQTLQKKQNMTLCIKMAAMAGPGLLIDLGLHHVCLCVSVSVEYVAVNIV